MKIGVPTNHYYEGATEDVRRLMETSLAVLSSFGARVVELEVPDPALLFQLSNAVTISEAATIHGQWLRSRPQDYSMYVRSRIE